MLFKRLRRRKIEEEIEEEGKEEPQVIHDKAKPTWRYFIPVIGIAVAIWYFTRTPIYLASLAIGSVVSYYYGSKMIPRDSRPVMKVDIDTRAIRLLWVGKNRWERMEKTGAPVLQLETPGGNVVEIVKNIDPIKMTVQYYPKEDYTDLHFLTIPGKLEELINKYVKTENENLDLTTTMEITSLEKTRKQIAEYNKRIDKVLGWKGPQEEAKKE
jgi:hypothetical protein